MTSQNRPYLKKFPTDFKKKIHGRCQIVVWEGLPSFTSIALFVFELSRIFGSGRQTPPPLVKRGLSRSATKLRTAQQILILQDNAAMQSNYNVFYVHRYAFYDQFAIKWCLIRCYRYNWSEVIGVDRFWEAKSLVPPTVHWYEQVQSSPSLVILKRFCTPGRTVLSIKNCTQSRRPPKKGPSKGSDSTGCSVKINCLVVTAPDAMFNGLPICKHGLH